MIWFSVKRKIKFFYQRWTRGWDDSDLWSLDCTISEFIIPRLKLFRDTLSGYPGEMTMEEWEETIDDMIFAFEYVVDEKNRWEPMSEEYMRKFHRYERGMRAFSDNFMALWN
jgi:hypothetical protein